MKSEVEYRSAKEREQIEWEEEKGGEILEETDRIVVKTEALKDESERERATDSGGRVN